MHTLPPETRTPNPILSKRRVGLAGVAALLGCVACCAGPLLGLIGLGGGAVAALTSIFRPGSELLVGGGIFVVVLSAMAARQRLSRKANSGCGSACNGGGGCCDASSPAAPEPPNAGTRATTSNRG